MSCPAAPESHRKMRVYRNETEIKRKEALGRRLSLVGLLILFVGLLASFVPTWYPPDVEPAGAFGQFMSRWWATISFGALPIGFLFASVGSYFINRFALRRWPGSKRLERPDQALERSLKGFDDKYAFFSHSLPIPYLLSGPCGVLIFVVRSDKGKVTASGNRWREPFSLGRVFTIFAREGVGNPARDVEDQAKSIREMLSKAEGPAAEQLKTVPVDGAAVFLNPLVQLEVDDPAVPALRADQVKEWVRRKSKEAKLQQSTVRALNEALAGVAVYQAEEETE